MILMAPNDEDRNLGQPLQISLG